MYMYINLINILNFKAIDYIIETFADANRKHSLFEGHFLLVPVLVSPRSRIVTVPISIPGGGSAPDHFGFHTASCQVFVVSSTAALHRRGGIA